MKTLEEALKVIRENNNKITQKVCWRLADNTVDCLTCVISKSLCCGLNCGPDDQKTISILVKAVRKQRLSKLLEK